jgi:hypothetical protein
VGAGVLGVQGRDVMGLAFVYFLAWRLWNLWVNVIL